MGLPQCFFFVFLLLQIGTPTSAFSANQNQARKHSSTDMKGPATAGDEHCPTFKTLSITRRNALLSTLPILIVPTSSRASLFADKPKRQLELCIVSLLRIIYWAERAVRDLESDSPEVQKQRYLEVRLASKALVTGKLGGGANYQVYTLNTLQLKDCLSDLISYAEELGGSSQRRLVEDLRTELIESLASVVEFDGLETTLDPSPRSSLTMSMYTSKKGVFVKRTLSEKIIPTVQSLVGVFGSTVEDRCVEYVQKTYPEEVPAAPQPVVADVGVLMS